MVTRLRRLPSASLMAYQSAVELLGQIEALQLAKEAAVADQEFPLAVQLRDKQHEKQKQRQCSNCPTGFAKTLSVLAGITPDFRCLIRFAKR